MPYVKQKIIGFKPRYVNGATTLTGFVSGVAFEYSLNFGRSERQINGQKITPDGALVANPVVFQCVRDFADSENRALRCEVENVQWTGLAGLAG